MAPMKMSWHTEGGRLATAWCESETTRPDNPEWLQSLYSCDESARRPSPEQPLLSPFGKLHWFQSPFVATRAQVRR
jgi:hypothetical protein